MSVDLTKIRAASFLPGLQTVTSIDTTITVNGTIPKNKGNLIGSAVLQFPATNLVSCIRATFPDAHGDLASYWFPFNAGFIGFDATANVYVILSLTNNEQGRLLNYDLMNASTADITLTNWRIHTFAHLYTYAW